MLEISKKNSGFLSGSTLKLIACVAMFIDHFGLVIYPNVMIYRILGRLAYPIFAYFIVEGCKYTRNKLKHFLLIFSVGTVYFFFYLIAYDQVYPSIFLTFSVSILNVYLIDALKRYVFPPYIEKMRSDDENSFENIAENNTEEPYRVNVLRLLAATGIVFSALAISYIPFYFVVFDYGYIGMLAPVLMSLFDFSKVKVPDSWRKLDCKLVRLAFLSVICISLAIRNQVLKTELFGFSFTIQVFNLFSLPLLALYNGKVGTKKLKYFFYAFYPVHLGIIMVIKIIIDLL